MGNNLTETTTKVGDMKGTMCNQHGQMGDEVIMKNVSVVPTSGFNLFSITKLMNNGWTLHGIDEEVVLTKGKMRLCFDIKVDTPKGAVYAMYIKRETKIAVPGVDGVKDGKKTTINIMQVHELLAHCDENATRDTAKHLVWNIVRGKMPPWEVCHGKGKEEAF